MCMLCTRNHDPLHATAWQCTGGHSRLGCSCRRSFEPRAYCRLQSDCSVVAKTASPGQIRVYQQVPYHSGSPNRYVPVSTPPFAPATLGTYHSRHMLHARHSETQAGVQCRPVCCAFNGIGTWHDRCFNWACWCSGRSRGFGFITFDDGHDAKDAVDDYERKKKDGVGTKIDGREVRVAYSLTKKAHDPTRK